MYVSCSTCFMKDSYMYYCLDCKADSNLCKNGNGQKTLFIDVLCQSCFNEGDHEGHKVLQQSENSILSCTCGDSLFLKKEGNCKNHCGIEVYQEFYRTNFQKIGKTYIEQFNNFWGSLLYQIFDNIESCIQLSLDRQVQQNIMSFFIFFVDSINKYAKNHVFLTLFGQLLTQKIMDNQVNKDRLSHNCENIQEVSFLNDFQKEMQQCNCSFIENLIRLIPFYSDELVVKIGELILLLRPVEQFSDHFSGLIPKVLNYIYYYSQNSLTKQMQLNYIPIQSIVERFSVPSKNGILMIKSKYYNNIPKAYDNLLTNYSHLLFVQYVSSITNLLNLDRLLTAQQDVCLELINETDFLENLFYVLSQLETKSIVEFTFLQEFQKYFTEDIALLIFLGKTSVLKLQILDSLLKNIRQSENNDKIQFHLIQICKYFLKNYKSVQKFISHKINQEQQYYNQIPLTLSMVTIILHILQFKNKALNQTHLLEILKEYFYLESKEEIQEFTVQISNLLEKFNFSCIYPQFLSNVLSYQLTENMSKNYEYLLALTLDSSNYIQDYYLLMWQIVFLINPNILQQKLLNPLLLTIKKDKKNKKDIQEQFKRITVLLSAENPYANLMCQLGLKNDHQVQQILKNTLASVFQISDKYIPLKTIKSVMNSILPKNITVEDLIEYVADFDPKQRKFTLKKSYENKGNYISIIQFDSIINRDQQKIKQKAETNSKFDQLFLESQEQDERLSLCTENKMNFYQNFAIIEVVELILDIQEENELYDKIVSPYFILILYDLIKYLEFQSQLDLELDQQNQEKLQKSYDAIIKSGKLLNFLKNVIKEQNLQELHQPCKILIEKIKSLQFQIEGIQLLKQESSIIKDNSVQISKEEERKRKIKERQQKIMKNFQEKRNKFQDAKKITSSLGDFQSKDTEYCILCHEELKVDTQPISIPIFIKQLNLLDQDSYVYINSCNHKYHTACWNENSLQNLKKLPNVEHLFRVENEIQCSLCKKLSNFSLVCLQETLIPQKQIKLVKQYSPNVDFENIEKRYKSVFQEKKLDFIEYDDDQVFNIIDQFKTLEINSNKDDQDILKDQFIEKKEMKNYFSSNDQDKQYKLDKLFDIFFVQYMKHLKYLDLDDFIQYESVVMKNLLLQQNITNFIQIQEFSNLFDVKDENQLKDPEYLFMKSILGLLILGKQQGNLDQIIGLTFDIFQFFVVSRLQFQNENELDENSFKKIEFLVKIYIYLLFLFDVIQQKQIEKYDFHYTKGCAELFEDIFKSNIIQNIQQLIKDKQINFKTKILDWNLVRNCQDALAINQSKQIQNQFGLFNLPQNYDDFSKKISNLKCELCKQVYFQKNYGGDFRTRLITGIDMCLLCGKCFCKMNCNNTGVVLKDSEMVTGNLNKHAYSEHNGIGLFISTKIPFLTIINFPLNIILRPIYTNQYGEEINNERIDWNNFTIDQYIFEEIKNMLFANNLPSFIQQKINNYDDPNKFYYKNYLL